MLITIKTADNMSSVETMEYAKAVLKYISDTNTQIKVGRKNAVAFAFSTGKTAYIYGLKSGLFVAIDEVEDIVQ